MDLFKAVVDSSQFNQNFARLLGDRGRPHREVMAEWAAEFADRDGKFVKEFQTTFNSSFWELYLFACLKNIGAAVDLKHSRPDFVVTERGTKTEFCIEACTANHAQDADPEWTADPRTRPTNVNAMVDAATIRIAGAFSAKLRKYRTKYRRLKHVAGKPFVVALAPFDQAFFFQQRDLAIQRVLYGLDTSTLMSDGAIRVLDAAQSRNRSRIDLGYFARPMAPEISAVLFSHIATVGKAHCMSLDPLPDVHVETFRYNDQGTQFMYEVKPIIEHYEHLLEGLQLYLNPYASNPLPPEVFGDVPGVVTHWSHASSPLPLCNIQHRAILSREIRIGAGAMAPKQRAGEG